MTLNSTTSANAADATTRPLHEGMPSKLACLPEGTRLDRYIVLEHLGSGGMGAVYRVHDAKLKREVALKVVLFEGQQPGPNTQDRLLAEARAMAKVTHPNVLPVHDVELFDDAVCIAMEYVDGSTFDVWLAQTHRSPTEILDVLGRAGRGLAAAHAGGLVHGDFKPQNILVGCDGRVRVTDFGLAQAVDDDKLDDKNDDRLDERGRHQPHSAPARRWPATTHVVYGTPQYMAPERHLGHPGDARSDQYSFCVTVYEALHGSLPEPVPSTGGTALRSPDANNPGPLATDTSSADSGVVTKHPVMARHAGIPRRLNAAINRGLEREPDARWPSMTALLDALSRSPTSARRQGLVTATLVAAVAAVVVALPPNSGDDSKAITEHATLSTHERPATPERMTERLTSARALEQASRADDATTVLAALELDARNSGDTTLQASVLFERAVLSRWHDIGSAHAAYEAAHYATLGAGQADLATVTATAMAELEATVYANPSAALQWSRHADAAASLAARTGRDNPAMRAQLSAMKAVASAFAADLTAADKFADLALRQQQHLEDGRAVARTLSTLATLARIKSEHAQALSLGRRAWVAASTVMPASHPLLLSLDADGIADLIAAGDAHTARRRAQTLLQLHGENLPPTVRGTLQLVQGVAAAELGDYPAARAQLLAAGSALTTKNTAPEQLAAMWHALAVCELERDNPSAAAEHLDDAFAQLARRHGDRSTATDAAPSHETIASLVSPSTALLSFRFAAPVAMAMLETERARANYLLDDDRHRSASELRTSRAHLLDLGALSSVARLDAWLTSHDIELEPRVASRRRPLPWRYVPGGTGGVRANTRDEPAFPDDRVAR